MGAGIVVGLNQYDTLTYFNWDTLLIWQSYLHLLKQIGWPYSGICRSRKVYRRERKFRCRKLGCRNVPPVFGSFSMPDLYMV